MEIRAMMMADSDSVLRIYQAGIDTGNATFETTAPTWPEWNATHSPEHRLVAVDGEIVLGWVALTPISTRKVYAGVAEHSVYVATRARGRGVGKSLLLRLIESTEAAGIWTLQSGLFPENTASIALHKSVGFRVVGVRERIAEHFGRWRDVILVERRSEITGN
ncbi:MAG: N-acetyltransferase [Sciscionella sp.]|nr:N-acetyltransferase [Sciscionella sp.]